jgi:hypothetical protein
MPSLADVLNSLHPPVRHELITDGDRITLRLIDEVLKVDARRSLAAHELEDPTLFRVIVLYAVNELRSKGSHAALSVLPRWD